MKKTILSLLVVFALAGCSEYADKYDLNKSAAEFGTYSEDKYAGDGTSGGGVSGESGGQGQEGTQIEPGQITAGEWSDLDNWTFGITCLRKRSLQKCMNTGRTI